MSFVKPQPPVEDEQKAPAEEPVDWYMKVWQALEGEKRGGVHPENLKVFTAAIMKILLSTETPPSSTSRYGAFTEDGRFLLNQQQATRVHKDFILLYLNRTAYACPTTKAVGEGEYTFKPSLCELSVSIANASRAKQPADPSKAGAAEHVEHLIQNKERKEAKLRKKKEDYEQSKKAECTFKPQINEYKPESGEEPKKPSKHVKVSTSKSTGNRCQALYELAKKIVKKEDKPTDDYIFEKEKDEYTFAPNLAKEKVEIPTASVNAPMTEETIERLKKGREERERIKKGTQRGIDDSGMRFDMESSKFKKSVAEYSKQFSSSGSIEESKTGKKTSGQKKSEMKSPTEVPLDQAYPGPEQFEGGNNEEAKAEEKLYIDVNLGEDMKRIVVRKGDTAADLAASFSKEHNLSEGVRAKLESLIEDQMKNLLENIEEEAEVDPNKSSP